MLLFVRPRRHDDLACAAPRKTFPRDIVVYDMSSVPASATGVLRFVGASAPFWPPTRGHCQGSGGTRLTAIIMQGLFSPLAAMFQTPLRVSTLRVAPRHQPAAEMSNSLGRFGFPTRQRYE